MTKQQWPTIFERTAIDDTSLSIPAFSPICTFCAHWNPEPGRHCAAFPKGGPTIPMTIWLGKSLHMAPVAGDHGIQFAPEPDAKLPAMLKAAWDKQPAK